MITGVKIPRVRNATTAEIVAEQILLCESILPVIRRVARHRAQREVNDEIRRRLRLCNDFLGMAGSRKFGCLYRETGLDENAALVCDHVIPTSVLVTQFHEGQPFAKLALSPIARISSDADARLRARGLAKKNDNTVLPFIRYLAAEITVETIHGDAVDANKWTIERHWELVESIPEMATILHLAPDRTAQ